MKFGILKVSLFISLLSSVIACKQANTIQIVNGIVMDASMNNVTLITDKGDTLNISTMNADPSKVQGVLINDSVKVEYMKEDMDGTSVLKAISLAVTVHSPYYYIKGTWIEPNPIDTNKVQGFILNQDGTAKSVGMATLEFNNWNLVNRTLTLGYKSIGNGQTIEGIDTLSVIKINADSLVLSNGNNVIWRLSK